MIIIPIIWNAFIGFSIGSLLVHTYYMNKRVAALSKLALATSELMMTSPLAGDPTKEGNGNV